jgi:hypothetical protein
MFTAGLLSIALVLLQDVDYFLGLWNGVTGNFDLEGQWFLTPISLYTGLMSIFAGLLLMLDRNHE